MTEPFDQQQALSIHSRLLENDPTAAAEIAELLLQHVLSRLQWRFSSIDNPHLLEDAAHTALVDYIRRPDKYIPSKAKLLTFIVLAASRDLQNLLATDKRHRNVITLEEHVADSTLDREYTVEVADEFDLEGDVLSRIITDERLHEWVTDADDRKVLQLMMEGVRETEPYAELIGVSDLDANEQAKVVKARKDRLKKLLKRRWNASEVDKNV